VNDIYGDGRDAMGDSMEDKNPNNKESARGDSKVPNTIHKL